jgi:hypothetical protein
MTSRIAKVRSVSAALTAALAVMLALSARPATAQAQKAAPATPKEMVRAYDALADAILSVKKTEAQLVRSILSATYAHGQVELGRARAAIQAGDAKAAQPALENLAADVSQLGTEGDIAVAAVRKRLLEGGHHHNAAGEAKGIYDEGYVVVTRAAKQALLDAARAIGQMAAAPKAEALDAEWKKVESTYAGLMKSGN